ncbi:hypothetical protein BGX38DRAFT_1144505 [Terfezia claveryi]|nr:hypothetical protein BGX38DRAFT_1144505 [Terfezia claveryi]
MPATENPALAKEHKRTTTSPSATKRVKGPTATSGKPRQGGQATKDAQGAYDTEVKKTAAKDAQGAHDPEVKKTSAKGTPAAWGSVEPGLAKRQSGGTEDGTGRAPSQGLPQAARVRGLVPESWYRTGSGVPTRQGSGVAREALKMHSGGRVKASVRRRRATYREYRAEAGGDTSADEGGNTSADDMGSDTPANDESEAGDDQSIDELMDDEDDLAEEQDYGVDNNDGEDDEE